MVLALSLGQLNSSVSRVEKIKYFPIELFCSNMLPNSDHDVYFEGVKVNSFCKPFGGNLGDPIRSDANGRLTILFLMSIQYNQQNIVTQTTVNNLVSVKKAIEIRSSMGESSFTYIPMVIKA